MIPGVHVCIGVKSHWKHGPKMFYDITAVSVETLSTSQHPLDVLGWVLCPLNSCGIPVRVWLEMKHRGHMNSLSFQVGHPLYFPRK